MTLWLVNLIQGAHTRVESSKTNHFYIGLIVTLYALFKKIRLFF